MGRITDAIEAAKSGDLMPLLTEARDLPRGELTTDFDQDGVPATNEEGEGFNTITAAWMNGTLTDAQYCAVQSVAQMNSEHRTEVAALKPAEPLR